MRGGAWSVEARRVVVVLDEEVRFTGGWIRVCEARILPVPAGLLPLAARRTGLLMPEVGYGRDGLLVGLPVAVVVAPWLDLRLKPEWRSVRGIRGLGELRAGLAPDEGLELRGAIGRDLLTEERRGAMEAAWASLQGGPASRLTRAGGATRPTSQTMAATSCGDERPGRSHGRFWVGGPLAWRHRHSDTPTTSPSGREQRPIAGAVELRGLDLGPVVAEGGARVDLLGQGAGPGEVAELAARGLADVGLMGSHAVGPLRGELVFTGLGVAWEDSPAWARTSAGAGVALDTWGSWATYVPWEPGPSRRGPVGRPQMPWCVLPMRWLGPGGGRAPAGVVSSWRAARCRLTLRCELAYRARGGGRRGGFGSVREPGWPCVQADPSLQDVRVGWRPAAVSLEAGSVRHAELWQAAGGVAVPLWGPLSGLEPAWRGLASVPERALLSHGPSLRYRSPCDCLEVDLGATWARDRELPDLRFDLRVY